MALNTIVLNIDVENFVNPLNQDVQPGDKIKFQTTAGAFSVRIRNAISFLDIEQQDLTTLIDDANPDSAEYLVRDVDADINEEYDVYCITNNSWPDSPPKIIIINR